MSTLVYIATDSNRSVLLVGISDNPEKIRRAEQGLPGFGGTPWTPAHRWVYYEAYPTAEAAQRRQAELSRYTRMQKERLIRRQNPNWLSLNPSMGTVPLRIGLGHGTAVHRCPMP